MSSPTNTANSPNSAFRPPVVVVLGHVDHGKTKLLSLIRNVAAPKEAGNITQHIGAYQINQQPATNNLQPKKITFLDTPGHEAFTAIRSRGARVADIAILVVAADESVKPQTREAIEIIKNENMPFIVAINKIDKEGANVQRVKQDLAIEDVLVEDWGGKIPSVEISAKMDKNIPELLDMILLVAELEELKEDVSLPAEGVVIESHLDKRRGYVATVLVQKGILSLGDWITVGKVVGKIKSMEDFNGKVITEAIPSQPVMLTGWSEAPDTGVNFTAAYSRSEAEELAEDGPGINLIPLFSFLNETVNTDSSFVNTDSSFVESFEEQRKKTYNLVLKADVRSSLEAVDSALRAISSKEVRYNIIRYDIGDITENDIKTAIATKSDVIGFRIDVGQSVKQLAEKEGVKVQTFDVIYELIETIRKNMSGLLEPEIKRTLVGRLKVLALFKKNVKHQIVGGKVLSGKIIRGAVIDVIRPAPTGVSGSGEIVGKGRLGQLQQNKEDVSDVKEGLEAGIRLDAVSGQPFEEVKEGDILEVYNEEEIQRTL